MITSLPKVIRNSTPENPLSCLEDILSDKGLKILIKRFKPTKDDIELADLIYNEENEEIIRREQNDFNELEITKHKFSDYLQNIISEQLRITKDNIDKFILSAQTLEHKSTSLLTILDQVNYIHKKIEKEGITTKYNFTEDSIISLKNHISSKYNKSLTIQNIQNPTVVDIPEPDNKIKVILEKSVVPLIQQATKQQQEKKTYTAFRWKSSNPKRNSLILHDELISKNIISNEINVAIFHKYFLGEPFEKSVPIKWIDKARNKKYNKKSLIYLINQLAALALIDEYYGNQQLYEIIETVFVRGDDKPFENLAESDSSPNAKNKTHTQKKIDIILETLLSVNIDPV